VMVTIGIPPTEPATGYGYIQVGEPWGRVHGRGGGTVFHRVERFIEKPPVERAIEYVEGGRHRWNAGMFLWSCATILEGLREFQPLLYDACERWRAVADRPAMLGRLLARDFPGLPRISIDYALMERARNVVVADGDFGWDDLGSWAALGRHLKADAAGNRVVGTGVQVDSSGNLVFDARTKGRTPIALVGLRDTICVQTDDAVLLAHASQAQKVKELVKVLGADPRWRRLV
jgi:mannose-1-phosphate guanylyltransferase